MVQVSFSFQGLLSLTPDVFSHSLAHGHEHKHSHGGHHQGIDMEHPILALNMMLISIGVKEGYVTLSYLFVDLFEQVLRLQLPVSEPCRYII